ncbi:histone-arginine methyltransferase CARMER-like isoform X2 [Culicoides brevitarsis]|uniref:histone-arginine methyltransferase CARMER-like isoform X2 n=1 Tax=Culicoides brevitarsis TaxID=469753 RepID=UPI00307B1099
MEDLKFQTIVYNVNPESKLVERYNGPVDLTLSYDPQGLSCKFTTETRVDDNKSTFITENSNNDIHITALFEFPITTRTECVPFGDLKHLINLDDEQLVIEFKAKDEIAKFRQQLCKLRGTHMQSVFSQRTEESSASQYFQFYGYLSQQQNMMQDFIRTSTYQKAIHSNVNDFADKIVLDVGAGSGILSFFAVQAGAAKVYAVEASNMAQYAQQLIEANMLQDKIQVIAGKIEEIELPQKVDIIISEPMGYMLYNERMLETYLHAKKWLKPGGKMFPSRADLHVAVFSDDALYMEQYNKANFWYQTSFHSVDLSSMRSAAMKEYFRQPIVDTFDMRICMAKSIRHVVDFLQADETDLHRINVPLEFHILETGTCHGLAFWFDVEFGGSQSSVWLSTAPTEPLTHWYQVRCLLQTPILVKQGQILTGYVTLTANKRQSYDVAIHLKLEGTNIESSNTLDLKNPYFRYTGAAVPVPPGSNTTSPSENYWNQLDAQGARSAVNLVNGITAMNGLHDPTMDLSHSLITNMHSPNISSNFMTTGGPSIHPGSIPSTGRRSSNSGGGQTNGQAAAVLNAQQFTAQNGMISEMSAPLGGGNNITHVLGGIPIGNQILLAGGTPTSTQNVAQQQLIGGAISPSLVHVQQQQQASQW